MFDYTIDPAIPKQHHRHRDSEETCIKHVHNSVFVLIERHPSAVKSVRVPSGDNRERESKCEVEDKQKNPNAKNGYSSFLSSEERNVSVWFYNAKISINRGECENAKRHLRPVIYEKTRELA